MYSRKMGMRLICNVATVQEETCLKLKDGVVVDRRGEEYNDCRLYARGRRPNANTEW